MVRRSLTDMPPEILFEILTFLDAKTMILCSSVSRAWHATVNGSSGLQYAIQLWVDGLVAGDMGALTPTDTLHALHERRRAWYSLQWTSRTVIEAESLNTSRAYELVGGILAQQELRSDFCTISLAHIMDIDRAKTKHPIGIDLDDFQDFALDPSQNLLVVLYQPANEWARLECRTLSSHQAHPLAPAALFSFPLDRDPALALSIQIADDVIALSFPDNNRLIILNWREGITLIDSSGIQSPLYVADFEFLSPRSYVLAFPSESGRIEIHMFEGGRADATTHVATLWLPALVDDRFITSLGIYSGPFCARPMPGRPYTTSNERRIYMFSMNYNNLEWSRLFVHYRTLQKYVSDYVIEERTDPLDVPWNGWGPNNSRLMRGNDFRWLRHVHGERVVLPISPNRIQLLDFGVAPDRPDTVNPPQVPGVVVHLQLEPTPFSESENPADEIFEDEVITSLPFRSTLRSMGEFDVFLIDQDHIIGANKTIASARDRTTIFRF
ncbi:hypothetical protein DFH07DRAFT_921278 [Mycena maculata]|uniref:F-box domain-containing protein n=1 Tax=Mycena maculata TaxID=230809 RepID=A0AAD7IZA8_9AGAR|nr:hypothetical protein DFH07DRAFT_921278 [Mycena maculata]